jgi:hypothetical protein
MKKVLLFFLISGFALAQDVTYSLEEMFIKIVDSQTLSPAGKVFLMGYFEDMDPIEFEVKSLSQMLCEEEPELFLPSRKGCEENLVKFLLGQESLDKAATLEIWGNTRGEAGGTPTYEGGIKVIITIK